MLDIRTRLNKQDMPLSKIIGPFFLLFLSLFIWLDHYEYALVEDKTAIICGGTTIDLLNKSKNLTEITLKIVLNFCIV